jgi:hypothetical protein
VRAEAAEMLVDRVVDSFPNQMVQARAVVNVADVHTRAFTNRLEPLQNRDVVAAVARCGGDGLRRLRRCLGH